MSYRRLRQRACWLILAMALISFGSGHASGNGLQMALAAISGTAAVVSLVCGKLISWQWRWREIRRGLTGRGRGYYR